MPDPVNISTRMKLVMHINHTSAGWSEVYYLKTTNYPDGLESGRKIVDYRRSLLAYNCEIVWARVSFLGSPRERHGIIGLPIGPLPQVSQGLLINDPQVCLHYAFESAAGAWGNRYFRGVPDEWINDYKYKGAPPDPLPIGAALSNPTDGAISLIRIQQSFLRYLIVNTAHVTEVPRTNPRMGTAEDWQTCLFRKTGSHKTGRLFGQSRGRAA